MKDNLNLEHQDSGKISNLAFKENLNIENKGEGMMLESTLPEQNIEDMVDLTKQLVIYQKIDDNWEDLVEMDELEEGEIMSNSSKMMVQEDSQNLQMMKNQNVTPKSLGMPVCKEIVPFRNEFELEETKEEGKDIKHKSSQRKKIEKKSNTVPKGVKNRSSKLDQQAKVKRNVGDLDKAGRNSSRKTREMETMQNRCL